jgi:hypothetical protein
MKAKYDYDNWDNWDWRSNNRYYKLSLSQNLFSEWIIMKQWGGLKTRIQGTKTIYCKSVDEIKKVFKDTHKRRLARGYALVN